MDESDQKMSVRRGKARPLLRAAALAVVAVNAACGDEPAKSSDAGISNAGTPAFGTAGTTSNPKSSWYDDNLAGQGSTAGTTSNPKGSWYDGGLDDAGQSDADTE